MNTERIFAVNSFIQMRGEVHLRDLAELFPEVSTMTLRRDIDYLEKQGHIVRTRGGAKSIRRLTQLSEEAYSLRNIENSEKKAEIAQKAVQFFGDASSYYIDAGTTMMHFAKQVPDSRCFIITNAPNIAVELSRIPEAGIIMLGGNLRREHLSISGEGALDQIKNINIDVAFIATSGYSRQNGFTNGSFTECELKRSVLAKAKKRVLLMDSGKYDKILPYTFAAMGEIDFLVSDSELPPAIIEDAKKHNTTII